MRRALVGLERGRGAFPISFANDADKLLERVSRTATMCAVGRLSGWPDEEIRRFLGDRESSEIAGVGELQQHSGHEARERSDCGRAWGFVAIQMEAHAGKERDNKRPSRNGLDRTDRIKEERQDGSNERERDD
jgi:hypothetical protein